MKTFFKKKKPKTAESVVVISDDNTKTGSGDVFQFGTRSIDDMVAASSIKLHEDDMEIDDKYVRVSALKGYPAGVGNGWLDDLYNYNGDMDVVIDIEPADDRKALDDLTAKISQYEAQYMTEVDRGNIKHTTELQSKIASLYEQRGRLEQNVENMFHVQALSVLYAKDKKELNKESQKLKSRLVGRKIIMEDLGLRQDAGFRTALPFAKEMYINEYYRNLNTGAVSTMFPFYNSEISHRNGVLFGINTMTATPIYIDMYNKSLLDNANISVFGKAGSGKTFFVSLLTLRSALSGIRTVILDPEGEYRLVTERVSGSSIIIAPKNSEAEQFCMNPFDIEEEEETDDDGLPTGQIVVNIKEKVASLLNLITVMCQGTLNPDVRGDIAAILTETYTQAGITNDPASLYINSQQYDPVSKKLIHGKHKKEMPTLSDFHALLVKYAQESGKEDLIRCADTLKMFVKGGVYDLFDCHTDVNVDFNNAPVVRFDLSQLEESVLRPIGMFIALQWTWEMFAKKNPYVKKRIVVDEAWMFLNKGMAGSDYTADFLENCARRIRKRNGGLCVASQGFREFANSKQGQAVLQNTTVKCFMKQDSTDIASVQDSFQLSDGEREYLLRLQRGEMLIKMQGESSTAYVFSFDFERKLIQKSYLQ